MRVCVRVRVCVCVCVRARARAGARVLAHVRVLHTCQCVRVCVRTSVCEKPGISGWHSFVVCQTMGARTLSPVLNLLYLADTDNTRGESSR